MTPTPDPYAELRKWFPIDRQHWQYQQTRALLAERDDLARQLAEARAALRDQHRDEEDGGLTMLILVRCTCCRGTGTVELTGEYLETFRALQAAGETWGARLAAILGCKPTAANNRLARLKEKGLVISRRYGRRVFYRVTTDTPERP